MPFTTLYRSAYSDGPTETERFRTRIGTPLSLSARVCHQGTRRRAARVQVERRAGDQDVHLQAEQAHRLLLAGFGHGGKLQVAGIDHGQRATALDFQHIVRADRSEEHTSALQSLMRLSYAVFCLKKNKNQLDEFTRSKARQGICT